MLTLWMFTPTEEEQLPVQITQLNGDCIPALKMHTTGVLKQESIIIDEVDLLLKRIHSTNGRPHDMTKEIRLVVTNVICTLVFGSRYHLDDPSFQSLLKSQTGLSRRLRLAAWWTCFPG